MKVSINEIKNLGYKDVVSMPVDELVASIGAQLGVVEDVEDLGAKYEGVVVAKVMSCEDHPNADRLHVCKVDDGGRVEGVERDADGYVQVVCGAPNVREGLLVAWLPPGSTVPETYHHEAPFVLEARELRDVVSNGMLASAKELALGDSHDGILEIDAEAKPGQAFADVYHLADHIIDIENKMFTHRPDCFGLLGVARELAGIQHKAFKSPEWYLETPKFTAAEGLELDVENDIPETVPRFMALAMDGVEVKPSPLWLQTTLLRLGSRPINNVVDITNYLMLLTGQPLHAYDYDKVASGTLGVRMAREGEKVRLINDKEVTLTDQDAVVTNGKDAIGLCGVMGGFDTEVDETTKRIIVEVANINMYVVRKSSMRHGLFTDAVSRFNKGQSPLQNDRVIMKAAEMFSELAGAKAASHVIDHSNKLKAMSAVTVPAAFVNARLGLELSAKDMATLLANVECVVEVKGEDLKVLPPFWRTDIEIPEDVVEEVGRLYGYDRLPRELPLRSLKAAQKNPQITLKQHIRESLSRAGANEVLTYSFVHENIIKKAGQDAKHAYQLSNALSPDLQFYRLSLTPSLLDKVHTNVRAGFSHFALFEINKVHFVGEMDPDEPTVPNEDTHVALTLAYGKQESGQGSAFYQAKRYLEQLVDLSSVTLQALSDFDMTTDEWGAQLTAVFEPGRSAVVVRDGQIWGVVGEYRQAVKRAFKLPDFAAGFEVHADIVAAARHELPYAPLSRFPGTERDITLAVAQNVRFADVRDVVERAVEGEALDIIAAPTGIYQPEGAERKNITFKLKLTDLEKTITADVANEVVAKISQAAASSLGAEII